MATADTMWAIGPIEDLQQFDDGNIRWSVQGNDFSINPSRFDFHKKYVAPLTAAFQTNANLRVGYKYGKPKNDGGFWLNVSSLAVDDGSLPPPVQAPAAAPQPVLGIPGLGAPQMTTQVAGAPQALPQAPQGLPQAGAPGGRDRAIRASVALKAAIEVLGPLAEGQWQEAKWIAPYAAAVWELAAIFDEQLDDLAKFERLPKGDADEAGETISEADLTTLLQQSLGAEVVE